MVPSQIARKFGKLGPKAPISYCRINILTRARRSISVSRRTRAESFGALSRHSKFIVQGVIGANVAFEIVIPKKEDKLTKFGGAIKSGVLIQ